MADPDARTNTVDMDFPASMISALTGGESIVAFTGAGMSSESGVPTFRGTDGIWKTFRPEELASLDAFMKNPELVWEWYAHRKRIIAGIQPNPGHYALAQMEHLYRRFTIITQNIDNLHRRAGSTAVHELHGNIERNYCMECHSPYANEEVLTRERVPRCHLCNGLIRPDVVWFGELLPDDAWERSVRAARTADVLLSIGTSGIVYPAASIPIMAKQQGAYVVEINPEPTPLTDHADAFLQGKAGVVLPALLQRLQLIRPLS